MKTKTQENTKAIQGDRESIIISLNKTPYFDKISESLKGSTIKTTFDRIIIEIATHNNYIRHSRFFGYKYLCRTTKTYPPHFKHPYWEIAKYKNVETGNIVVFMINDNLIRLIFHSEENPLSYKEVKGFTDLLLNDYKKQVDKFKVHNAVVEDIRHIITPQPYLAGIEIAVDIIGGDTHTFYEEVPKQLIKTRARKRVEYGGKGNKVKETSGHKVYEGFTTTYIGGKWSSSNFIFYLKSRMDGALFPRLEVRLHRDYLYKHQIKSFRVQKFDAAKHWEDNFGFYAIDWERAFRRINGSTAHKLLKMLHEAEPVLSTASIYNFLKNMKDKNGKKLFHHPARLLNPIWSEMQDEIKSALKELKF